MLSEKTIWWGVLYRMTGDTMKDIELCMNCGDLMIEVKNCSTKCFSCDYEEGSCA